MHTERAPAIWSSSLVGALSVCTDQQTPDLTEPMHHLVSLVIFDCDGVLVDSERLAVKVDSELLTELGWPLTEAQAFERFGGRTQAEMFADVANRLGDTLPPGWQSTFRQRYLEVFEAELTPMDGIFEALDAITSKTCVASNSTPELLRMKLDLTGLDRYFNDHVYSATHVTNAKPAPDLFLYAAEQMDVAPAQCVVVEDSETGVRAARSAGMRVLAFTGGLSTGARLEGPATTTFADLRDLPQLIAELGDGRPTLTPRP